MSSELVVLIAILALLALLAIRTPVAFALLVSGTLGLTLLHGLSLPHSILGRLPFQIVSSFSLVVVPLFIVMGAFASKSDLVTDAFALASRLLRRVPGGLALATISVCAAFAAVTGSSPATVATVGQISITEMRRYGYSATIAAGVVGAAGTLGVLIPPSIALVLYGIVTQERIGALLIAGIIPGVISALLYAAAIFLRGLRHPEEGRLITEEQMQPTRSAPAVKTTSASPASIGSHIGVASRPDAAKAGISAMMKITILFTVVIGGIYTGVFTATEASALGALTALVILVVDTIRSPRRIIPRIWSAIAETTSLTGMIFAILIGSGVFGLFLVYAGVPRAFTDWVTQLALPPLLIVALLLLILIPLGMFLDPISILLITMPIAYPAVSALGFSGIWFGVLVVKMIEIGMITPPLGFNAYVLVGITKDLSIEQAFKGVMWFLPVDAVTVALLFFVPLLTTWLPSVMGRL